MTNKQESANILWVSTELGKDREDTAFQGLEGSRKQELFKRYRVSAMQNEEQFWRLDTQQGVKDGDDKFYVCVPQVNCSSSSSSNTPLKLKGSVRLDPICCVN